MALPRMPLPAVRRTGRMLRRRAWTLVPLILAVLAAGAPTSYSVFHGTTSDGNNTLTTAASFPTVPASVTGDGPQFYHRSDDSPAFGSPTNAADSSGNTRTGQYTAPTDGASTWYRFDDGSGGTAADSSGAANPGTLVGGPTWSAGHVGTGGLTFNGSNRYVTAASPAVDTGTSFTVATWAYLGARDGNHHTILSQDGTAISAFYLKYDPISDRWQFTMLDSDSTSGAQAQVFSPQAPTVNQWTHLVGVYNAATNQIGLYVNGALVATAPRTTSWSSTGPLIVGAARWAGSRVDHFNGGIDDVHVFRRALSGTEISQLYGAPSTWWDFNTAGFTQTDRSGNANTGTLANGPAFASNGVVLNGTTQYGTGDRPGTHTDRDFSVAAWVYPSGTTGTRAIASQPGGTSSAFTLAQTGAAYTFSMTSSDVAPTTTTVTSTTAASTTAGAHVVGVYSAVADEMRLYINGALEKTATFSSAWDATGVLNVGRALSNGTYGSFFYGRVDDLKVFDQALSTDDVNDLYNAPTARYDFDEPNSDTTVVDGTGNGNTLSRAAGTATWMPSSQRGGGLSLNRPGYFATSSPVLTTNVSYSMSAWAWLPSAYTGAAGNRTILSQDGTNTSAFMLQHSNVGATNQWMFQVWGTDDTANAQYAIAPTAAIGNRWTHLVATFDKPNNTIKLYVNGALAASAAVPLSFNATGPLIVGSSLWGTYRGDYWPGYIDEVATYQKLLTATDVTNIYHESSHLSFDLNENTGTSAWDHSGGTAGVTLTNGPTWTTGKQYNAVNFDGVNDYAIGTGNSSIDTNASLTVSAWVYLGGTGSTRVALSQNSANYYAYALGYNGPGKRWTFSMSNSNSTSSSVVTATSTSVPTTNTWTHLAGVYDAQAQQIQLYVNGVREATATKTLAWTSGSPLVMGYANTAGSIGSYWSGRIDEVYAYQRALRDTDVQALYGLYATAPAATAGHLPGMTAGVPGALQGAQQGQQGSTAVAFNGTGNGYNPTSYTNPTAFTVECWFRTTSSAGGTLIGFATDGSSSPANRDRLLYLDSGNKLTFGVYPGSTQTVRSAATYNDGQWHHVAASLGAAGMKLYVDGALIAGNAGVTTARNYAGVWRWGGEPLLGWPNQPANDNLVGSLDEVAVYASQLTDNQIARHYAANH